MSNNPQKLAALEKAGLHVVNRLELEIQQYESFANYLRTKREKMGHIL